ncbi:hypothetical protein Tco_1070060 [Tanacetum coccineum]|uniref:Uncharacterized protein n=1 Tax=Tanacetum coccineum TaxID=301880 RepID=A0ABQ5HMH0_9ASTR
MFRYVENVNHNEENIAPAMDVEGPANPEQVSKSVHVLENHTPIEVVVTKEEPKAEVVSNPPERVEKVVEEEEQPVPEVVDESPVAEGRPWLESMGMHENQIGALVYNPRSTCFGTVGRLELRIASFRDDIEVVAIKDPFINSGYMIPFVLAPCMAL